MRKLFVVGFRCLLVAEDDLLEVFLADDTVISAPFGLGIFGQVEEDHNVIRTVLVVADHEALVDFSIVHLDETISMGCLSL